MIYPLDRQNTKKLKSKMLSFYQQQSYLSQIVWEKVKILTYFFMKKFKNNNIILGLKFHKRTDINVDVLFRVLTGCKMRAKFVLLSLSTVQVWQQYDVTYECRCLEKSELCKEHHFQKVPIHPENLKEILIHFFLGGIQQ